MLALLANISEYIPNLLGHPVYWKIVKNRDEVYILAWKSCYFDLHTHNLFDGFSIKKGISDLVQLDTSQSMPQVTECYLII